MDIKAYAAYSKDDSIRFKGTSGGIFMELALKILSENGYVCGCVFEDDFYGVKHIVTNKIEDITRMQGAKYIPSDLKGIYPVIEEISKNHKVLFTGTPCQVGTIKNIIQNDNIIAAEIICRGVSGIDFYKSYIDHISNGKKIKNFSFCSKKVAWELYGCEAEFEDGSRYFKMWNEDPFLRAFLKNINLRPSCYSCPYARLPRVSKADISLADYRWLPEDLYDKRGVSLVLTNTPKGDEFFKSLDVWYEPADLCYAALRNKRIYDGFIIQEPKYMNFTSELKDKGFKYVYKKYIKPDVIEQLNIAKLKYKLKFNLYKYKI